MGFDLLIVCGFAFDPHVDEEAKRYGKLTVLPTRMNPDLAMGDELLKKTGAGNLFMVFGEPDVEHRATRATASSSVEIHGRRRLRPDHRRDPQLAPPTTSPAGSSTPTTTARASSSATPTSPAPTSPTKAQARPEAEIDEDAWSTPLLAPSAAPSTRPKTGKIAVKVINHYGDEVLKVYTGRRFRQVATPIRGRVITPLRIGALCRGFLYL